MSDKLDDLFGAIDGDEEEEDRNVLDGTRAIEGLVPNSKPSEHDSNEPMIVSDHPALTNNSEMLEQGNGNETVAADSQEGEAVSASTNSTAFAPSSTTTMTKDAKKIYTSVMAAPTASRLRDGSQPKPSFTNDEKETKEEDAAVVREIATGTSHDKSVRSYSAYPKNLPEGHQHQDVKPSEKPAKEYPFPLDPFQAQAIGYIEKEESVLVAAHTSAGKTAVAEYAIAKSLNNGQRVVYTSPIKVK